MAVCSGWLTQHQPRQPAGPRHRPSNASPTPSTTPTTNKQRCRPPAQIPAFADVDAFLRHIAAARGKLKRGGVPDLAAAARVVLQDWNGGAIPFYTLPPSRGNEAHESAAVVAAWAAEFDADKVFAAEEKAVIAHLPTMEGGAAGAAGGEQQQQQQFFAAASAGRARVELPEEDMEGSGGGGSGDEDGEEDEQEGMDADSDDYGAAPKKRARGAGAADAAAGAAAARAAAAKAAALYGEEGQLNPHKARAEKRARKKAKKLAASAAAAGGDSDSDFDFDAANGDGGSGSDGDDYGGGGGGDADAAYADDMEGSDLE